MPHSSKERIEALRLRYLAIREARQREQLKANSVTRQESTGERKTKAERQYRNIRIFGMDSLQVSSYE
jgi:hypothetical protein